MTTERLLTPQAAAEYLGIAPGTLKNWRYEQRGPPFVRCGARIRYRSVDIERWAAEHVVEPEAMRP